MSTAANMFGHSDIHSSKVASDVAYGAFKGSPFDTNRELYSKIGSTTSRELVDSLIVPIRSGRAWEIPAGHICRITTPEGPLLKIDRSPALSLRLHSSPNPILKDRLLDRWTEHKAHRFLQKIQRNPLYLQDMDP